MKINVLIADQSAASDLNSTIQDLGDLQTFSISVDFTGADVVGVLKLQSRNDDSEVWKDISGSTQAVAASTSYFYNVQGAGYRFVRVVWDYTSGTGNILARCIVKENPIKGA